MQVTVVGLGYVGLTAAVVTAHLGHHVLGVDIDGSRIAALKAGDPHFYEPQIKELLQDGLGNGSLRFAHSGQVEREPRDVVLIAVGTPSLENGSADTSQVSAAMRWVVDKSLGPTVIAMKCSVPPGSGIRFIKDELKGSDCQYVANPEFLRQGSAVRDWLHPTRIVVGGRSSDAVAKVLGLYRGIEAPVIETDVTSAEMIKMASNAFLVTKISYINEIAMLCERVGGHIDDVTRGLALDPRIGDSFLGAGIGWGGSCFPKDARALEYLASENGNKFDLLQAVIAVNDRQRLQPLRGLRETFGTINGLPVAVLGLTFKPGTDDLREAPAVALISALVQEGAQVCAYDPVATRAALNLLPEDVRLFTDPLQTLDGARAAVLTTEWPQIVDLDWSQAFQVMEQPRYVFDGRNVLDQQKMTNLGFQYRGVGRTILS